MSALGCELAHTLGEFLPGAGVLVPLLCGPLSRRRRYPDQLGQLALFTRTRKLIAAPPAAPSAVRPPAHGSCAPSRATAWTNGTLAPIEPLERLPRYERGQGVMSNGSQEAARSNVNKAEIFQGERADGAAARRFRDSPALGS